MLFSISGCPQGSEMRLKYDDDDDDMALSVLDP